MTTTLMTLLELRTAIAKAIDTGADRSAQASAVLGIVLPQLQATAEARQACWCETCRPITFSDMRMVICPTCGNKRCPHATFHGNACTGSNDPGQPGSSYENCGNTRAQASAPEREAAVAAGMALRDRIEKILLDHCLTFSQDEDGSPYRLIDLLSVDADDIGRGKKETHLLADAIAGELPDLYTRSNAKAGEVVVTRDESGEIVAVTRQDEDGQILSVIATRLSNQHKVMKRGIADAVSQAKAGEVEFPDALRSLSQAATPGMWRSMRDGNQYLEASYMPTAKCVGASRIDGPKRPWNPHALIAFGFKPEEYEKVRMTDADADFVCALVNWCRETIALSTQRGDASEMGGEA